MSREELKIDEYLKGCKCSAISFHAGAYILVLTIKGSALISPDGEKIPLSNHFLIIRHHDDKERLIQVEVAEDFKDKRSYIFYMMYPTGTFIYE